MPIVVTPWTYGDRVAIHAFSSSGPQPGSNEINAPPVGLTVAIVAFLSTVPSKPCTVQFLKPVASLT